MGVSVVKEERIQAFIVGDEEIAAIERGGSSRTVREDGADGDTW